MPRRKKRRNGGGFWPWATKHWIISGLILLPTAIMMPVYLVSALRPAPPAPPPSPPRAPDLGV